MATAVLGEKPKRRFHPAFLAWVAFLLAIMGAGVFAAIVVWTQGLEVTGLKNGVPWGLWITVDLSAIGLGAGAFTMSAMVYLFRLKRYEPVAKVAVFVGLLGYTSAMFALLLDLGRPDRFWHPIVHWNIHSVLWEITWCVILYLSVLVVEVAPIVAQSRFFARWPRIVRIAHVLERGMPVVAVGGMMLSLLHQSSLGATFAVVKGQPLWFKPTVPFIFITRAMAAGPAFTLALILLTERLIRRRIMSEKLMHDVARLVGIVMVVHIYMRFWDMAMTTYYAKTPIINRLLGVLGTHTPHEVMSTLGDMVLGAIIPAVILLIPALRRCPATLIIAGFLAAGGLVLCRWNCTVSGLAAAISYVPETTYILLYDYVPTWVEWISSIAILAYGALGYTLGVRFLPLFDPPRTEEKAAPAVVAVAEEGV